MGESTDTIAAIATPHGMGGIAVIRISGPDAIAIADKAWKGKPLRDARSHTVHYGTITDADGLPLDQGIATVFRAPASFTGEDVVELSVHGSKWIQQALVQRLCSLGARAAGPGEFSRRAFVNGKIDLAQAEGIADLIEASSRAAHRLAASQTTGRFSKYIDSLRDDLIQLCSLLELELDFSEEEVEFASREKLTQLCNDIIPRLRRLADSYAAGRAIKEGVPVVIAGRPNAGKSTLLNALLHDDRAIVSEIPGTTRDIIEATAEIRGILFRFFDTAGLRDTPDPLEKEGIQRARAKLSQAAIILWLLDPKELSEERVKAAIGEMAQYPQAHHIVVISKSDVSPEQKSRALASVQIITGEEIAVSGLSAKTGNELDVLCISAKTGEGIEELERLMEKAASGDHNPDAELIVTNARHQAGLTAAADSLERAREGIESGLSADFIAQDTREALHHLAEITGAITTPHLLHSIFTRFCIGK